VGGHSHADSASPQQDGPESSGSVRESALVLRFNCHAHLRAANPALSPDSRAGSRVR